MHSTCCKAICDLVSRKEDYTMKYSYVEPILNELGAIDELTGSNGYNNDDGYGWSVLA